MACNKAGAKLHVVCMPFPVQGHINAMFKLANLLHSKGFHITFVNSEFNQRRILNSLGPSALVGLPDFRYETIPDGLPYTDISINQNITSLLTSTQKYCSIPFLNLLIKLSDSASGVPPVTCVVSDGITSFTLKATEELRIPNLFFWSTSACGALGLMQYKPLIEAGLVPLKSELDLTNGYLDTPVNCIPGFENLRLRDIPSFIRTTSLEDKLLNFFLVEGQAALRASGIILNSFHELEGPVIDAMASIYPPIYDIGPLSLHLKQNPSCQLKSTDLSVWEADRKCLEWLDSKEPQSVVYISFGSITTMTNQQLREFAWGLANSGFYFLWVIRSNLVTEDSSILPEEFIMETKGKGILTSWCPQEEVLAHPAVGVFLTHGGWNSMLEAICNGIPMICWPFFADQQTNCRYMYNKWKIGLELDNDVKREEVESLIKEMMTGNSGKEMKKRAMEWKESAAMAVQPGGTSFINLDKLLTKMNS